MERLLPAGAAVALLAAAAATAADERDLAYRDRIAELERKVDVLADELERTRSELAVPEEMDLESRHGFGPAASKIYDVTRGLSIGGYGEAYYQNLVDDEDGGKDRADFLRMVLYAGYKFRENLIFNAEIEFEHATSESSISSGDGSVSVEFAALDFLIRPEVNARAGLLLVPMGFLNEIHEPPFFLGVNRPEPERRIIPSTWRENGVGLFGALFGEELEYRAYVVNGFNAAGFSPGGLRDGRQNGNRALAEHVAFVSKLDWTPLPSWLVGGSVYVGKSGQNSSVGGFGLPDALTTVWELHSQYRSRGFQLRGLFTMAHVDDARTLSSQLQAAGELDAGEAVAQTMLGAYGEIGYDIAACLFPDVEWELTPFFRFEYTDTQLDIPSGFSRDGAERIFDYVSGIQWKPIPNVVVKADYRNRVAREGSAPDEVNLGIGFAF